MFINRHNYEEFFILYMDNELSAEDRRAVETFVDANADLKEELTILLQSKIVPDETIVFDGKEELMKFQDDTNIHMENYEEWLLLYTDNELSTDQKKTVEKFAVSHPAVKTELDLLLQARLEPELAIVFPNKESLYRKEEEKIRVIAFSWRRIAVAASLLLAVGTTAVLVWNKKEHSTTEVAVTEPGAKKETRLSKPPDNQSIISDTPSSKAEIATGIGEKTATATKENEPAIAQQRKVNQPEEKLIVPVQQKQNEPAVATTDNNRNNLPAPKDNPNVNVPNNIDNTLAINDTRKEPALTNPKENKTTPVVTPGNTQPSDIISVAAKEPAETIDMTLPEKKTKLRGFFRKVTRTFEKTTNIKATDDDDRLLLGGLAIKL